MTTKPPSNLLDHGPVLIHSEDLDGVSEWEHAADYSDYAALVIEMFDVRGNTVDVVMTLSDDSGATYISSYRRSLMQGNDSANTGYGGTVGSVQCGPQPISDGSYYVRNQITSHALSGHLTNIKNEYVGERSNGNVQNIRAGYNTNSTTTVINGVKVAVASGTFSTKLRMWGVK